MSIATRLMTADEYAALPDTGFPTELVRGVLITMNPPRLRHGFVCANVSFLFRTYARQHHCGRVFCNDSGVITERDPDTVRGAAVAYYSYQRLPKGELPGYSPTPPEVVVEVLSPDDRPGRVAAKVQEYLTIGVSAVVVLDPEIETAHVYHPNQPAEELAAEEELRLDVISPEFRTLVSAFFEDT
jgi:Uma2 family endonuclease